MSEHHVVRDHYANHIPEGMSDDEAWPVELCDDEVCRRYTELRGAAEHPLDQDPPRPLTEAEQFTVVLDVSDIDALGFGDVLDIGKNDG